MSEMAAHILIAFDKFKGALSAEEACEIAARAIGQIAPSMELDVCPITDGGEGFAEILTQAAGGSWHTARVSGPLGDAVEAGFGLVTWEKIPARAREMIASAHVDFSPQQGARVALVEMASAAGLASLPVEKRDPWRTSTRGVGELLRVVGECGAEFTLLGVGGSATNDLGLGALSALGLRILDEGGCDTKNVSPKDWLKIRAFDAADLMRPPLSVVCDVRNPLLGPEGCTRRFGPQKGLLVGDIPRMEAELDRMSEMMCGYFGKGLSLRSQEGMGAAGGIAFGFSCALGAPLISGQGLVREWLALDVRLARADVVLTGEGRFDVGSLQGKGPGALALAAANAGKSVFVFCGSSDFEAGISERVVITPITPCDMPLSEALAQSELLLAEAVGRVMSAYLQ